MPSQKLIPVDPEKFRAWCRSTGVKLCEVSAAMGRYDSFISKALSSNKFPERQYKLFCQLYNVDPGSLLKDDPAKELKAPDPEQGPYTLGLDIKPDRVWVSLKYQGDERYRAYSKVRGKTELDLVQAISYAAHMVYKLAEQKNLQEG